MAPTGSIGSTRFTGSMGSARSIGSTAELLLRAITHNTCLQLSSLDVTGDQSGNLKWHYIFFLNVMGESSFVMAASKLNDSPV